MAAAPSMAGNHAQLGGVGAKFCLLWPLGCIVPPWGCRGGLLGCFEARLQWAMKALGYAGEGCCDQLLCSLRKRTLIYQHAEVDICSHLVKKEGLSTVRDLQSQVRGHHSCIDTV